jgi:hypothetical protein
MLTTSMSFEKIDSADDRHWRAVSLRESMGAKHSGMSRTPVARVYEMIEYKKRTESITGLISASALAALYVSKGNLNDLSEKISPSWVDTACTVFERALSVTRIKECIAKAEIKYGVKTPFQSIYTLECIIQKAGDEDDIAWTVESIVHGLDEEIYSLGDISQRNLTGKGQGGKGLVDAAVFRKRLAHFIAYTWVEKHPFDIELKSALRRMIVNHTEYSLMFGTMHTKVDIMWVSLLEPSGQQLLRVLEALSVPTLSVRLLGLWFQCELRLPTS